MNDLPCKIVAAQMVRCIRAHSSDDGVALRQIHLETMAACATLIQPCRPNHDRTSAPRSHHPASGILDAGARGQCANLIDKQAAYGEF
jgi:hypothetical protein